VRSFRAGVQRLLTDPPVAKMERSEESLGRCSMAAGCPGRVRAGCVSASEETVERGQWSRSGLLDLGRLKRLMADVDLEKAVRNAVGASAPGIVVVVVGAEGVRGRYATGFADAVSREPMRIDDTFPWFSMTKIATATTALRLVERGVLELDVPIAPLVPAMRLLRPPRWAAEITVRHLLQHSAGFSNPIPVTWIHPPDQPGPELDAFLERLLGRHRRLRFEPGARSSYSNLGALTVGSAISHALDAPFESIVDDEVLAPLRMSCTSFTFPLGDAAGTGHHPRYSPMRFVLPRWVRGGSRGRWMSFRRFLVDGAPYGALVGTADDAARFAQMHLNDGKLDGVRILTPDHTVEMRVSPRGAGNTTSGSDGLSPQANETPTLHSQSTSEEEEASST
jgi:CubicO group peptidase (beta-lactamase class C family)